jgi:hypothetical protein
VIAAAGILLDVVTRRAVEVPATAGVVFGPAVAVAIAIAIAISVAIAITITITIAITIAVAIAIAVTVSVTITVSVAIAVARHALVTVAVPLSVAITVSVAIAVSARRFLQVRSAGSEHERGERTERARSNHATEFHCTKVPRRCGHVPPLRWREKKVLET